jgi:putative FmdB family regulatory protein
VPIYQFTCETCGPFERRRDAASAGEPAACETCGTPARRVFAAPMTRAPGDPFASASRDVRARAERSRTGEPMVSHGHTPAGRPAGQVMHEFKHDHHHASRRPWLVGH